MPKKIRAIVTGATGMVGEGVLHECLLNPQVESVLIINRKPSGIEHPKLSEIIHNDFFDLSSLEGHMYGYNACFFCLGVSSVKITEAQYFKFTYMLTMNVARVLSKLNHDMTFCYVSGAGTDSSETKKAMWARVKGKTENDLMRLPFEAVYNFRPGYMHPTKGLTKTLPYYKYLTWLYPIARIITPKYVSTLAELGKAMINAAVYGYEKTVLEVTDIVFLAGYKE